MPRKKRRFTEDESLSKEGKEQMDAIVKPRRSTRQAILDQVKNNVELNPEDTKKISISKQEPLTKRPKVALKRNKVKDEICTTDFERSSPDSTDSGIGSGFSSKDESYGQDITKFEIARSFESDLTDIEAVNEKQNLQGKDTGLDETILKVPDCKKKPLIKNSKSLKEITQEPKVKRKTTLKKIKKHSDPCSSSSFLNDDAQCESPKKEESALQVLTRLEFESSSNEKTYSLEKSKNVSSGNDSNSDSDWEEVEENKEQNLEDYNPEIPKDGVEITIDCPELNKRKRKKKQFDEMEYIRLYINRERKEAQLNAHKTHLLCLIAHGLYVNSLLNSSLLKAYALSLVPVDILALTAGRKVDKIDSDGIISLVSWYRDHFKFENKQLPFLNIHKNLLTYLQDQKSLSASEYNLMLIIIARTLGFKTRFCVSLYPITYKAKNLLKKPDTKTKNSLESVKPCKKDIECKFEGSSKSTGAEEKNAKKSNGANLTKSKKKKLDNQPEMKKSYRKRSTGKNYKISNEESDIDDEDFIVENHQKMKERKTVRTFNKTTKKRSNRKILSSDSESSPPESCIIKEENIVCWLEIFCKPDKHWIPIECADDTINEPYRIEKLLPKPVTYILAFDNESYIKDVTRRYCSEYMTSTLKLRADSDWWEETLEPFSPPNSKINKEEEKKLEDLLINKPLPTTVSGFKNHPLYALKRHLLKFEGIYPPDAAPVGFLRGEPIYARECVCQLHSRETWLKEARVVRIGEEPYKIVKARPKWDRIAGVMKTDLPLEIFGFWQTGPYKPPIAQGGKVPRNEYGNVELFKPCMLPIGTVHLQMSGLNRIAKKLGIDCCAAVVGFDGHKGSVHPVFDGFIVCEEYKDTLVAAWEEEQENSRKREEEKREKRIYGNWRKLIRGLLIRERIKLKYDVK